MSERFGLTLQEMLQRMDHRELRDRVALENLKDKENAPEDYRMASVLRAIYATGYRNYHEGGEIRDYLPVYEPKKDVDGDGGFSAMMAWAKSFDRDN